MENAFSILANRSQVLLTTMKQDPSTVTPIVKTCLIFLNIMRTRYPGLQNKLLDKPENENCDFVPGIWREGRHMGNTSRASGPNTVSKTGKMQRNLLKHWITSPAGVAFLARQNDIDYGHALFV